MSENETNVIGYFSEDHQSRSMMRLMCFSCMWAAFVAGAATLALGALMKDSGTLMQYGFMLFATCMGFAFTGKVAQKFAEPK
jgi:hypothetical protein